MFFGAPIPFDVQQTHHAFHLEFGRNFRHQHDTGGMVQAFDIFITPEKIDFAIRMGECFDAFKKGLTVVQAHGSRQNLKGAVRHNAGIMPFAVMVIGHKHVVGAQRAERKVSRREGAAFGCIEKFVADVHTQCLRFPIKKQYIGAAVFVNQIAA